LTLQTPWLDLGGLLLREGRGEIGQMRGRDQERERKEREGREVATVTLWHGPPMS